MVLVYVLRSMDATLVKHPELALMDGTEIVALRKAEMAAKNTPIIDITPAIPNPVRKPHQVESGNDEEEQ